MEFALVTDLYRRMGQFEAAVVTCSDVIDSRTSDVTIRGLMAIAG